MLRSSRGFSLLEVMIAAGVMAILALGMLTLYSNQLNSNNYLEFQLKRNELNGVLVGQFLNDPNNCACLFKTAGASSFSAAANGVTLSVSTPPTRIGRYQSPAPGCAAPADFFVTDAGVGSIKSTEIQLTNIRNSAGTYLGTFRVLLESTKTVLGPKALPIEIPVGIATSPAGVGSVNFESCSMSASASSTPPTEFVLTANQNVGSPMPVGGGVGTIVEGRALRATILQSVQVIPGTFKMCVLSGYRTACDDGDCFDGCAVKSTGPGTWRLEAIHDRDRAVQCRVHCSN